jgi:hypothetical protein
MRSFILLLSLALLLASCNQNMESVRNGEMLTDSPKTAAKPAANARPLASDDGEMKVPPFAKAYFMHQFVEALYSVPKNFNPNPKWESPLADPEKGRVWCTDCHTSGQVDFAKIPKQKIPMNEQLEKNKPFMADLMKKWVARLNSADFGAKAKLKQPVTCLTCHETNPAP